MSREQHIDHLGPSPARTKAQRQLVLGAALVILGIAAMAAALPELVQRIGDRPALVNRPLSWFFDPVPSFGEFVNRGERYQLDEIVGDDVPQPDRDDYPDGYLELTYRGDSVRLPINPESTKDVLPGLLAYEPWFRMMPLAQSRGIRSRAELNQQIEAGIVTPRVIAVARYPAEGFDPDSWGIVRRKDWPYVFIEFGENIASDGGHIRVTRSTYGELEERYAPGPRDEALDPDAEDFDNDLWKHDAMLQVTPATLYRSKDKRVEDALKIMGWTWPTASAGAMAIVVGLGIAAASRITR